MITAVLDTNILASGTASFLHSDSQPAQVLHAWRDGSFILVVSEHILTELERTLEKPYFQARIDSTARTALLELLRAQARITPITVRVSQVATHPEDDLILAAAVSAQADYLVTGDETLRRKVGARYQGVKIVSPRQFVSVLEEEVTAP